LAQVTYLIECMASCIGEVAIVSMLPIIVQHIEEASFLADVRGVLSRAPHVTLDNFVRWDARLTAHLDGICVAGSASLVPLRLLLDATSFGGIFTLAASALQARNAGLLTSVVNLAETDHDAEEGLLAALSWMSTVDIQGLVRALFGSRNALHHVWGLAACDFHQVDPGTILAESIQDADPIIRARAWRIAGQLGRRDLLDAARRTVLAPASPATKSHDLHATVIISARGPTTESQVEDLNAVRRAAAWALTIGDMGNVDFVRLALLTPEPGQDLPCPDAHRLAAIAAPIDWGREQVRSLAAQAESSKPHKRRMLRLAGWVGDPQVIPWLTHHMVEDEWARLAGEAFCMITGADLDKLQLYRMQPEGVDFGPTEDPEDENVAMDEDDGLMWPDPLKVQEWWQANASRFTPGQRYFVGDAPSIRHCLHVLRHGYQRQRIMAAEYLCLLRPGSKLFPVAAPAWRQQRWLAEEEAALSAAHSAHAQASP